MVITLVPPSSTTDLSPQPLRNHQLGSSLNQEPSSVVLARSCPTVDLSTMGSIWNAPNRWNSGVVRVLIENAVAFKTTNFGSTSYSANPEMPGLLGNVRHILEVLRDLIRRAARHGQWDRVLGSRTRNIRKQLEDINLNSSVQPAL